MRVPQTIPNDTNLFIDENENVAPTSEPIYAEIVKPKKLNIEKPSLKRASWSPAEYHECGLPPSGKRHDGDSRNSNRVRMRSRPIRNYQLQQPHQISGIRPASFNERLERLPSHTFNRNVSLSNQRRQPADTLTQITKHTLPPSCDKNGTSTNPSVTTIPKRPLFNTYQPKDSDYKLSSSNLNPNTTPISSGSFTCQKGQDELSPSPKGSSLNQYHELTLQTESIDLSRDERCHPTTHRLMTMSTSPNRHHNQTHLSITNITNGLKQQQQDPTNSRINSNGSCLKTNRTSRIKKSVHFDWNPPTEIQSSTSNSYHPSVTVTSPNVNNEEKKSNDGETVKERERRTSPLTTHIIHRSFSLSPSPFNNEENNRRHRQQVKKVNVDELNRRVTFNDTISPTTKKSNGISENLTQPMPLNTLIVKTSSFNSPNSFLNFLNRTNPKAISIQRKSKRLSADVESLSKEDIIDKVTINHQNTKDNNIDSSNTHNRSSISMSTKTIKSDEDDSINNSFLFQPAQSIQIEPFYLSPPKSTDESSMSTMMQTSTLIISTPPQYHYYLYPPTVIGKKNSTTNISMNSISTNSSSSSSSSYEYDDDTYSYSTNSVNNPKQIQPVVLSDSVQNFWPPPPSPSTLNNDPEQILIEQNKQSQSNTFISSTYNDDSLSVSNGNQTDVLPPTTSLMLSNKEEEVRSYSEQSSFGNRCLRIESDSSFEDTQASYSERLREKSRSIKRPVAMNVNSYSLSRSRSKDNLNPQSTINRTTLRPKSAGQVRAQLLLSPLRQEISNDFQSKRQFFENRTYTDYVPPSTTTANNRIYTNSPINHPQRHVTKCSWNDLSSRQPPPTPSQNESTIKTTKHFDTLVPPTVYRKPVRIVKAVQRSAPSPTINDVKNSFPIKINEIHLSSQYIRDLFPIPDRFRRRLNSENNDLRIQQTDDLFSLNKRLEILRDNQRMINDEIAINTLLGAKLMKIIESQAEPNEIEKLKLHINEIETITSVLLKLSCRLAKVENDLLTLTDDNTHTKANLLEQREKIQQKHDEAKILKDGIDRRCRLVTNILRKYLSNEQFDDYEYFIRMKSILLMDAKDLEENILYLDKFILSHVDHLQTNA